MFVRVRVQYVASSPGLHHSHKTVHDDVTRLAKYGIVFLVEDDDRAKQPYLPQSASASTSNSPGATPAKSPQRREERSSRRLRWFGPEPSDRDIGDVVVVVVGTDQEHPVDVCCCPERKSVTEC